MTIATSVPSRTVALLDLTENREGFELNVAKAVMAALGVNLVHRAHSVGGRSGALKEFQSLSTIDFDVLVLIAHADACGIDAGSEAIDFNLFRQIALGLADKMIVIAGCKAFGREAIDAFVDGGDLGLLLVASSDSPSGHDIKAFVPKLHEQIREYGKASPEVVKLAVQEANRESKAQFQLYSGVGVLI